MKLLQINPVIRTTTSTGRIMKEISDVAEASGWQSYMAYSRGRDGVPAGRSDLVPVGNIFSVAMHLLSTRLLDRHGKGSKASTRRFVRKLEKLDPDVIQIHNIHGYFLDYEIFTDYLRRSGKPVVWTVHDCWLFTGHCFHYASAGCGKWQTHCEHCPQRKAFPKSILLDRSYHNFEDKRRCFTGIPNLTIVTVSQWMKEEMSRSFLKDCRFRIIHNGIDTAAFSPQEISSVRKDFGTGDRHIVLGVASIWCKEKGIEDFIRLDSMLDHDREVIVLVGVKESQKSLFPASIITVERTASISVLAGLYSEASAFANPTWQDNYPTVNMESISCGTPVVTYRTGGSVEVITPDTGFVVEQGDVPGMLDCIRRIENLGKEHFRKGCRDYALKHFRKEDRYEDYIELYNRLTDENTATR